MIIMRNQTIKESEYVKAMVDSGVKICVPFRYGEKITFFHLDLEAAKKRMELDEETGEVMGEYIDGTMKKILLDGGWDITKDSNNKQVNR